MNNILKKSTTLALAASIGMSILMSGCDKDIPDPEPTTTMTTATTATTVPDSSVALSELSYAPNMEFAINLFNASAAYSQGDNIMISPASITFALAMLEMGAEGTSKEEIMNTVFPGMSEEEIEDYVQAFTTRINNSADVSFHTSNSLWFNDISPASDYLDRVYSSMGAELFGDKFDSNTYQLINDWVSENTDGMINNMLSPEIIDPDLTLSVLVNAISFEGNWNSFIADNNVRPSEFTDYQGNTSEVSTMFVFEDIYLETSLATGFLKPYVGEQYAFMAILPTDTTISATDFAAGFTYEDYMEFFNSAEEFEVTASLPEFTTQSEFEMEDPLRDLGINQIFDDGEFAPMLGDTSSPVGVSHVIHSTFIDVNREGTRAAAATATDVETAMAMEPYFVYLNRPFCYAIVDMETGMPIFIGAVNSLS